MGGELSAMLPSQWGLTPSKIGFSSYFSQLALSLYLEPKTKKSFNCVREAQVWNIFLLKKKYLKYIWIWGLLFLLGALGFEKFYVVPLFIYFFFFVGLNSVVFHTILPTVWRPLIFNSNHFRELKQFHGKEACKCEVWTNTHHIRGLNLFPCKDNSQPTMRLVDLPLLG